MSMSLHIKLEPITITRPISFFNMTVDVRSFPEHGAMLVLQLQVMYVSYKLYKSIMSNHLSV